MSSMCFSLDKCIFWKHTLTSNSRYGGVSAICDGEMEYNPEMNESKILRLLFWQFIYTLSVQPRSLENDLATWASMERLSPCSKG